MPNIETSTSDVVTSGGREGGKRREGGREGGRGGREGREGGKGGREKVSHLFVIVLVCHNVCMSCSNFWNNNNGMSFKCDSASAVTNGSNVSNFYDVIIS